MEKHVIRTENAPAPFQGAPYSQAIRVGNIVYMSGQIGLDPRTGQPAVKNSPAEMDMDIIIDTTPDVAVLE